MCLQVLDAGEIQAYDEPYTLLQDPHGIFSKMVQQSGKQEAADLRASAKQVRPPPPPLSVSLPFKMACQATVNCCLKHGLLLLTN